MTATDNRSDFRLTDVEVKQFERDGYFGPFKVFEPEEMKDRWKQIQRQLRDRSLAIYPEGSGKAVTISNYDRHLDINLLAEHIMMPQIVDRVVSLLGPDVLCWRSEFFPKFQGDEGTDWHQAATFAHATGKVQLAWPAEPGKPSFLGTLTAWTAFTHSTRENGCLQLMPGTHTKMNYDESKGMEYDSSAINQREKDGVRRGFFGYDYRQLQKDPEWKPDESQAYDLVMEPGECVFFWSSIMHASRPHTGSKLDYRMGFAARYVPTQVRIYPNTDGLAEFGEGIRLDEYGAVLVAGEDTYGHNRLVDRNRRGFEFVPRKF